MKLNLGCAMDIKDGYVNIDVFDHPRVTMADVRDLSFIADSAVDEIYAKDVLEHMPLSDGKLAIKEWSRVMRSGAKIFLQTINLDKQVEAYSLGVWSAEDFNHMLFAGISWVGQNPKCEDFHKCAYTEGLLRAILAINGLMIDKVEFDSIDGALRRNPRSHNLNLMVYGHKE